MGGMPLPTAVWNTVGHTSTEASGVEDDASGYEFCATASMT